MTTTLHARCRPSILGTSAAGRISQVSLRPLRRRISTAVVRNSLQVEEGSVQKTEDFAELGKSGVKVSSLGVGAWSWGDRTGYWGYGSEYGADENRSAYESLIDAGINFIDTAEAYGFGKSEELVADFTKGRQAKPLIATKYAPLPWRFTSGSVVQACKASLSRLERKQLDLYMIHWPGFITNGWSNDAFVTGLADCYDAGLTRAVGVSNFGTDRLRKAHKMLQDRGIPLATNQVQYSLLYKEPERNGVLETCRELGITLVAYSPLCQGLLTGKYSATFKAPSGPRAALINEDKIQKVQPLLDLMREIGSGQGGKSPAQIAINWTICKGAIPIPGAKNARQVAEIAGSLGWRLTADEVRALDVASSKLSVGVGAPFEKW